MPPTLDTQAADFAAEMSEMVQRVLTDDSEMTACRVDSADGPRFHVGHRVPSEAAHSSITTLRGQHLQVPGQSGLTVSAAWEFVPNSTGKWIKVRWSQFGFYVKNRSGAATPFIRLEVDPMKPDGSWLVAHLNVTAESSQLGHILGQQGKPNRRLQNLHLPVGGFSYRPCFEDFLEFLIDEDLVPGKDGWKDVLRVHREGYREKQLMSLVRRHPEIASRALEALASELSAADSVAAPSLDVGSPLSTVDIRGFQAGP